MAGVGTALEGPLSQYEKMELAEALWAYADGTNSHTPTARTIAQLDGFFRYYQKVLKIDRRITGHHILFLVDVSRRNPDAARSELTADICNLNAPNAPRDHTHGPTNAVIESLHRGDLDVGRALAVAVRVLLAINIVPNANPTEGMVSVGQSLVVWENPKSLVELITDTYPTSELLPAGEPRIPIRPSRLWARYLEAHTDITVEWTTHLPDHLRLNISKNKKILQVFELPSLLEAMHESTATQLIDLSVAKSLQRGSYTPNFVVETLMTFELLFPSHDRDWLARKVGKEGLWWPLRWLPLPLPTLRKRAAKLRDQDLWSHVVPDDKRFTWREKPLTNRHELFERYPHWGLRLHILLEEAADPTPISRRGRWAERRKAARHSFWVTVLAFGVAIAFGIVATVLALVQLWIAWCTWQGPDVATCRTRAAATFSSSTTTSLVSATALPSAIRYRA